MPDQVNGPAGTQGTQGPGQVGHSLTPDEIKQIQTLLGKVRGEKNAKAQMKAVDQLWQMVKPEVQIEPPAARYLVRPPDDPGAIHAEYIFIPPPDPDGGIHAEYIFIPPGGIDDFNPTAYENADGAAMANMVETRGRANIAAADAIDDGIIAYYLVMPPPNPDPEQTKRRNDLTSVDADMNKTFDHLLDSTEKLIADGKVHPEELINFEKLHYSFDLSGRLLEIGLKEYMKDYPNDLSPAEPVSRNADAERAMGNEPKAPPPTEQEIGQSRGSVLNVQTEKVKK